MFLFNRQEMYAKHFKHKRALHVGAFHVAVTSRQLSQPAIVCHWVQALTEICGKFPIHIRAHGLWPQMFCGVICCLFPSEIF